jgi:hypothetical protein
MRRGLELTGSSAGSDENKAVLLELFEKMRWLFG